jgi:hypothetical protein
LTKVLFNVKWLLLQRTLFRLFDLCGDVLWSILWTWTSHSLLFLSPCIIRETIEAKQVLHTHFYIDIAMYYAWALGTNLSTPSITYLHDRGAKRGNARNFFHLRLLKNCWNFYYIPYIHTNGGKYVGVKKFMPTTPKFRQCPWWSLTPFVWPIEMFDSGILQYQ